MSDEPRIDHARPRLLRNWLSLAGAVLSASAFFAFLLLFAIDLFAHNGNPYMGILAYVVAPGFLESEWLEFDPASVPAEISINLELAPLLHGRVSAAGLAVPGASVGAQHAP